MRYDLVVNIGTESQELAADLEKITATIASGDLPLLSAEERTTVQAAATREGEKALIKQDRSEGTTILTNDTDKQALYFEAGNRSRIWLPWGVLPEHCGLVRLRSRDRKKEAFYERCCGGAGAIPLNLARVVTEGGLFRRRANPVDPRQQSDVPTITVDPMKACDRVQRGLAAVKQCAMLNPLVVTLDTMVPIDPALREAIGRLCKGTLWDVRPKIAVGDWLRARLHAGLERAWRGKCSRSSPMLRLLLGPEGTTGCKAARAFPILDVHGGRFRMRSTKKDSAQWSWSGGHAAKGDILIGHTAETLHVKLEDAGRETMGDSAVAPDRRARSPGFPLPSRPVALEVLRREEVSFEAALVEAIGRTVPALSERARQVGGMTTVEHEILKHDLHGGSQHPLAALERWCVKYLVPRSPVEVQCPEPPGWLTDRADTERWRANARLDTRGGGRDLPRGRAALWWLRLLDPDGALKVHKAFSAEEPGWKSRFYVWLFRGARGVVPEWDQPRGAAIGGALGENRLGKGLRLGAKGGEYVVSMPGDPDWPTVLES